MFLKEEEYRETLALLSKKSEPDCLLKEMRIWAKEFLQVEVYNYLCDYTSNGLRRLRLVLWDDAAVSKMHDGMNLDKNKQKAVAERFARLSWAYQKYPEYQDAGKVFVCYETIRDEIQKRILQDIKAEIMKIRYPGLWRIDVFFESIHIFYETDQQVVCNETNGVSNEIRRFCTQILKKHDLYNVFPDGANCTFSSHQTITEKYKGNMFFYYHG